MAVMDRDERRRLYRDTDAGTVMLAEFLAAPLVWGGIGWAVDTYLLGSFPLGVVVGSLVGFILGMYLMYVRMQAQGRVEDERRAQRARVSSSEAVDPPGRVRVSSSEAVDPPGRVRVSSSEAVDPPGRVRVSSSEAVDPPGSARRPAE